MFGLDAVWFLVLQSELYFLVWCLLFGLGCGDSKAKEGDALLLFNLWIVFSILRTRRVYCPVMMVLASLKSIFEHQYEKNLLYQNIYTTFACLFLNTVEMDVSHSEIQTNTQTHTAILQNFICEIQYLS